MADSNSTLTQDVNNVIALSFPIETLLIGALSLIDDYSIESNDEDGKLFHAQKLIEMATAKTKELYSICDQLRVLDRTRALEEAGERHV